MLRDQRCTGTSTSGSGHPSCFAKHFASLVDPGCMLRLPSTASASAGISIYVINARRLHERRKYVLTQLKQVASTSDTTIVLCADTEDIRKLPLRAFCCLHPFTLATRYVDGPMADGTVSLALKHMIAMKDMLARNLPLAVVLEDDATLVPNFTAALGALLAAVPEDANMLHLGSYRRCDDRFGHDELKLPTVAPRHNATRSEVCFHCVHRRQNASGIVGAVGLVHYARGARQLIGPVVAPADVHFSMQAAPMFAPSPTYGPADFLVWPAAKELGLGKATHISGPDQASSSPALSLWASPGNLTARQQLIRSRIGEQQWAERMRQSQELAAKRAEAAREQAVVSEHRQAHMSCMKVKQLHDDRKRDLKSHDRGHAIPTSGRTSCGSPSGRASAPCSAAASSRTLRRARAWSRDDVDERLP